MTAPLTQAIKKQLSFFLIAAAVGIGIFSKHEVNELSPPESGSIQSPKQNLLSGPGNGFSGPSFSSSLTVPSVEQVGIAIRDYPYQRELGTLSYLKTKVLLDESEQKNLMELYENQNFLNSLLLLLAKPSHGDPELARLQNEILDFLYEGLNTEAKKDCSDILLSLISNNDIEQDGLNAEAKESLAGIKAEVLYHLSAQAPELITQIEQALPGPISQKLWENVVRTQKLNLAESQQEFAKY